MKPLSMKKYNDELSHKTSYCLCEPNIILESVYDDCGSIFYEIFPLENKICIKLYLHSSSIGFVEMKKSLASHVLEQVFDEEGNILSEEIKEL